MRHRSGYLNIRQKAEHDELKRSAKVLLAAVLAGILAYYTFFEKGTWEPLLAYGCFVGSVMVSYLRARAEGLGIKCEVGIFTRVERVIVMSIGLMFGQWYDLAIPIMLGIVTALAFVTVLQRLIHVQRTEKS